MRIGRVGPHLATTPTDLKGPRAEPRQLPPDLLREASGRLQTMLLMAAVLWLLGPLLYHLALHVITPEDTQWNKFGPTDGVAVVCSLGSLALYQYIRRTKREPQFILDLGLIYMVLSSAAFGVLLHWEPPPSMAAAPMITWIGVIVVTTAAFVPSPPRKMLVAGLIAATMNPIGMFVGRERGVIRFTSLSDVLGMHYPDYLLVGIAVVIAHVVTGLGQQVARARELGSYQLGDLLGRGGMGEVYRATHRMLARPAAIKLIRPEMLVALGESAQLAEKRFRREARAAANLRSPHTVELYDFGVTDDQTLYFVMELLDGLDLQTFVDQYGAVPAARVIHILRQVCESLDEAHTAGLVHRDIKPANIHLGRLGLRHDYVKVLDFGLVKSVKTGNKEETLGTAAGLTPGTPAYMAPEMAMGDAVDGRADLYALGCVGYFLLTGQPVFDATNALQMLAKHLREAPVPPSVRSVFPVPPALDRLVLACLAKSPDERPRTAGDLGRALGAIEGERWGEEQAKAWWTANRPAESAAG